MRPIPIPDGMASPAGDPERFAGIRRDFTPDQAVQQVRAGLKPIFRFVG